MDSDTAEDGGIVQLASKLFPEDNSFKLLQKTEENFVQHILESDYSADEKVKSNTPLVRNIQNVNKPALFCKYCSVDIINFNRFSLIKYKYTIIPLGGLAKAEISFVISTL